MRPRAVLLLALLLAGCSRDRIDRVPAVKGTGTCRIAVGQPRDHVLVRCGPPCATGTVPQGRCPKGTPNAGRDACENSCDIYQNVEVCYAQERVVTLRHLDRENDRFRWCFWPPQRFEPEPTPDAGDEE